MTNTTYYYKTYATNDLGITYASTYGSSQLPALAAATITSGFYSNATASSFDLSANMTNTGGCDQIPGTRGFAISTTPNPVYNSALSIALTAAPLATGTYTASKTTGLSAGTSYYVRPYVLNDNGYTYASQFIATTSTLTVPVVPAAPTVVGTPTSSEIQFTVGITSNGGSYCDSYGYNYQQGSAPAHSATNATNGTISSYPFTSPTKTISGLNPGVSYYINQWAHNAQGYVYSSGDLIATTAWATPAVTMSSAPTITSGTTATATMSVSNWGGPSGTTAYGVCWKPLTDPVTEPDTTSSKTTNGSGAMTGLTAGAGYRVRAYATNSGGLTGYSTAYTIYTWSAPSIVDSYVSFTGSTEFSLYVTANDGHRAITECGLVWGTSANPSLTDIPLHKVVGLSGSGVWDYIVTAEGLSVNTIYHTRAFIVNGSGTAYGADLTVTTLDSAGAPVTRAGIVWNVTGDPTVNDAVVERTVDISDPLPEYILPVDKLAAATTYYVRSFAENSHGIGYGEERTFTTEVAVPDSYVYDRGILINSDGAMPVLNGAGTIKMPSGEGSGIFKSTLSGLTPGTVYLYRAYAVNGVDVAYGDVMSFQTLSGSSSTVTYTLLEGTSLSSNNRTIPVFSSVNGDIDIQGDSKTNKLRQLNLKIRIRGYNYDSLQDAIGNLQRTILKNRSYFFVDRKSGGMEFSEDFAYMPSDSTGIWQKFTVLRSPPFGTPNSRAMFTHFREDVNVLLNVEPTSWGY